MEPDNQKDLLIDLHELTNLLSCCFLREDVDYVLRGSKLILLIGLVFQNS
jgi:hypothetical protein